MDVARSFSEELIKDRKFEIGGEVFEWIYPHWEIGAKIFDDDLTPTTNGEQPTEFSFQADTKLAIERIPMFLSKSNDGHARFKRLAARKDDAVPRYQFVQLYRWLVQVTGGLPTTPPSSSESEAGDGGTDTGSAAGSPSTEVTSTA